MVWMLARVSRAVREEKVVRVTFKIKREAEAAKEVGVVTR